MTVYIDQTVCVSHATDNPANGVIRVTFGDVTLSLSLVQASWLAANLQREIRIVQRDHPELHTLVDFSELMKLDYPDRVMVRHDDGSEHEYVVKYPPWQLGNGDWVLGLFGISGGYLLERVTRILRKDGGE